MIFNIFKIYNNPIQFISNQLLLVYLLVLEDEDEDKGVEVGISNTDNSFMQVEVDEEDIPLDAAHFHLSQTSTSMNPSQLNDISSSRCSSHIQILSTNGNMNCIPVYFLQR